MTDDLPVIPLVQARLLTPFNTTYWTNFPTAENPYIHPGHWWVTGNYIIHQVHAGRAVAQHLSEDSGRMHDSAPPLSSSNHVADRGDLPIGAIVRR